MTDTRFCDISEHQPNVDQKAYYDAGYRVFIFRTHNGYRADKIMPARLQAARKVPFTAIGLYAYLVKDRDPVQQAHEFIAGIGKLQPNEFPILDYEEIAPGNQVDRAKAWLRVVDDWAGFLASMYSGDYFFRAYLGGTSAWGDRPTWLAAYNSKEPSQPHTWWQYTDSAQFPGIGAVDGNIYHGTAAQFGHRVLGHSTPAPPVVDDKAEQGSMTAVVKGNGAIETFIEKPSGEILHRWQKGKDSGDWGDKWTSLGVPGK
jgi:GH25 family lysozyme M1 (1,4-beta-N-acetylmuramidase)